MLSMISFCFLHFSCLQQQKATTRRRSYIGQLLTTADRCKRWMCCNLAPKAFGFSVSRGSDLDQYFMASGWTGQQSISSPPKMTCWMFQKSALTCLPTILVTAHCRLRPRPLSSPPWTVLQRLTNLTESTLPFLTWMDTTYHNSDWVAKQQSRPFQL